MSTKTRFGKEAQGNSKMAYSKEFGQEPIKNRLLARRNLPTPDLLKPHNILLSSREFPRRGRLAH